MRAVPLRFLSISLVCVVTIFFAAIKLWDKNYELNAEVHITGFSLGI